jgi:uncharacterized protein YecE (DUF72 family)
MPCDVRIGTSGWHYKHWRGPFYDPALPAREMLAFYLRQFDSVEINNSFYRLPTEEALKAWRESTPANFVFAMKASRFITHNKKLSDPESALDKFMPRAEILGRKLGPILFQLPPRWHVNPERLDSFLKMLPKRHRYAFEMRDPTWHIEPIYRLLHAHNAAFCPYDLAGFQSPIEITADFTYIRLHGPAGPYQGSYSHEALATWAKRIRGWRRKLKGIYVYFDNYQEAFAAKNALELKRLVG